MALPDPASSGAATDSETGEQEDDSSAESICVGVRLRPFVGYEKDTKQKQCLKIQNNTVSIVEDALEDAVHSSKIGRTDFAFDAAMDSTDPGSEGYVSQGKCYELMCKRMVGHLLKGYHTCLFCYGQTGTGKTTTIMGDPKVESEMGLLLHLLSDVFQEAIRTRKEGSDCLIQVQMLEVYNDKLNDLLHPSPDKKVHPEVRMNPVEGVYVKGSVPEAVDSFETCVKLIEHGNTMKTVAATAMNKQSSRGHTIFKLMLEQKGGTEGKHITSEAFFVDLAGRENEKTTQVTGDRFVELTFINLSLKFLADCIRNLGHVAKRKSKKHPTNMGHFRNSKLTMLLANALSGNSKTAMIGTLSPAALNFDESYSTLQFASTVKSIKVNAEPVAEVDKAQLVDQLRQEITTLKEQLSKAKDEEQAHIREKMEDAQELFEEYNKEWDQKLAEAKQMMQKREDLCERLGVCRWKLAVKKVKMASDKAALKDGGQTPSQTSKPSSLDEIGCPHLVNYSDDPYLTGVLVLAPREVGKEYCGGSDQGCDFVLPNGLGILPKTLYLKRNDKGQLWIWAVDILAAGSKRQTVTIGATDTSAAISEVEVNGKTIGSVPLELKHHDFVVIGRSLMFYVITEKTEKGLGYLQDLRAKSEVQATNKSRDELINSIMGKSRAPARNQMDMAKKYVQALQNFNRDNEGNDALQDFLLRAAKAKDMVDQANAITKLICPERDLCFELITSAPVLGFGFGKSRCPDLAVRLVRRLSTEHANQRLKTGQARRKSTHGAASMLSKFVEEGENTSIEFEEAKVEILFVWTFSKFVARLQLMQQVREEKENNPANFKVDPASDPWAEYGPGEIAVLQHKQTHDLETTWQELNRLREQNLGLAHELQQLRQSAAAAEAASPRVRRESPRRASSAGRVSRRGRQRMTLAGRFDGQWEHHLDGNRRVEVIEGEVIRWQDGTEMQIMIENADHFFVELRGSIFRAHLVNERLEWDDGDIWMRVGSGQSSKDELVKLLYVNNTNVEELCRTQQQLIRTVKDGMHSLDDKLAMATRGADSPSCNSPVAHSPMTPVPSLASHLNCSPGGAYSGFLGTTTASGTYLMQPPGGQQLLASPADNDSVVAFKACTSSGPMVAVPGMVPAPIPAGFHLLPQMDLQQPPAPTQVSPTAMGTPLRLPVPKAKSNVMPTVSPRQRAQSPTFLNAQGLLRWGGKASTAAAGPQGPLAPQSPAEASYAQGSKLEAHSMEVPATAQPWCFSPDTQALMQLQTTGEPMQERSYQHGVVVPAAISPRTLHSKPQSVVVMQNPLTPRP